jgi:hypothetical protein
MRGAGLRGASVVALDALIVAFAIGTMVVFEAHGESIRIGGLIITTETKWRPVVWLVGLLLLRVIVSRSGPFARPLAAYSRWCGFNERASAAALSKTPGCREIVIVTLALTAAVGVTLHEQFADLYSVPDLGDPLFSMWRIAWVAHQIVKNPSRLFDANIFYPEPGTLTYSDAVLLPALTVAPLLWMGVPVAPVYQVLFISAFILSGLATYLFARGFGLAAGPAWIAGLLFAICPYRFEHYSHLELQMAQWMPLALLAGQRWLATGRSRYAIFLALTLGGQWYSSMYYGVFLTVSTGVFVCVLALAWRAGWARWAIAIVALAAGIGLALPLARVYKSTEAVRGTRDAALVGWYSARGSDYFAPNGRSIYHHKFVRGEVERSLFPHFLPLTLGAIGALPPFTASRLAVLAFGVTAFDGSRGLNGYWYGAAYENLGPLKSMRVPARFAMLVNLALAFFAGVGAARLVSRTENHRVGWAAVGLLTTAALVESQPNLGLRPMWTGPPSLYASLGPDSGAVLFEYPPGADLLSNNCTYEYLSTWHWTPMVNGCSGFTPRSYFDIAEKTREFPLGSSVTYLQQRGVTHVTLHCRLWHDDACALTMERLASDPRFTLLTSTMWYGQPARLYRLSR